MKPKFHLRLLAVHEEGGVEGTTAVEHVAAYEEVGTSHIVYLHPGVGENGGVGVIAVQRLLQGGDEQVVDVVAHLRERSVGMDGGPLAVFEYAAQCSQAPVILARKVVEHLDGVVAEQGVGVEEEDIPPTGMFQPVVVALAEPQVLSCGQVGDAVVGGECLCRPVGAAVVYHDYLVVHIMGLCLDAVETGLQHVQCIVIDDDDGDVGNGSHSSKTGLP